MKKSHWLTIVIVLAIIIAIAIGIYLSGDPTPSVDNKTAENSKLSAIRNRMQEIETRIGQEMKALQLTTEMEIALNKKVNKLCTLFGAIVLAFLAAIVCLFCYLGLDPVTTILSTAGIAALLFPVISILSWRVIDFNAVIELSRNWVKAWLNKKYGHDPAMIQKLNDSVIGRTEELLYAQRESWYGVKS